MQRALSAPSSSMPRSAAQNRTIHVACGQLQKLSASRPDLIPADVQAQIGADLATRWRRACSVRVSGQASSSSMSAAQADALLEELGREIRRLTQPAVTPARRGRPAKVSVPRTEALITPKQQKHIHDLLECIARAQGRYADLAGSPTRLRAWCEHHLTIPWPQTMEDADARTEALKSILLRELPPGKQLDAELAECRRRRVELVPFGRELIEDSEQPGRLRKWGPIQWAKVHQVWLQLPQPRTAAGAAGGAS